MHVRAVPRPDLVDLVDHETDTDEVTSLIEERLARVLEQALSEQGLSEADVSPEDVAYAEGVVRSMVVRLGSRRGWDHAVGSRLTHAQTLELTGWSKQALSKAVRDHRVLRLVGEAGVVRYALCGFDEGSPARPIAGLQPVLETWSPIDPRGWAAASWLRTMQPELAGITPLEVLSRSEPEGTAGVLTLAGQATARLVA